MSLYNNELSLLPDTICNLTCTIKIGNNNFCEEYHCESVFFIWGEQDCDD